MQIVLCFVCLWREYVSQQLAGLAAGKDGGLFQRVDATCMCRQVAILLREQPLPAAPAASADVLAAMERRLDALQQALAQMIAGARGAAPGVQL